MRGWFEMSAVDVVVLAVTIVALAGLGWFFFGPRPARTAHLEDGVQRIEVTVRGGYSPDVIRVRQGVPVELTFDRQESGDCTSRVVFPDLRLSAALPAYQRTTVRFRPADAGSFGFACGMNMIHGTLVVDPSDGATETRAERPAGDGHDVRLDDASAAEAGQAAERRAEIPDLSRRVLVGAILTLPVLFAVMTHA